MPVVSGRVLVAGVGESVARAVAIAAEEGWACAIAPSAREALRLAREDPWLDLVVLAPGEALDPWIEICRSVKFDQRTQRTWVVCLLLPEHQGEQIMEAGADDCIRAIASDRELRLRLAKSIRTKHATESLDDAETVITALANAIEGKDHYTCGHVERVGAYSVAIGRRLGLSELELAALKTGGVVHDIGKIGTPDHVLNKPGKLTDEEMAIMQRHPLVGYDILRPLRTFRDVLPIVRWHHEKPNGKGYPDGIGGADLPLLPRIASVSDVFDALATDRPYRKAFPLGKCREILLDSAQKNELDAELVRVLLEIFDEGAVLTAA